MMDFARRQWHTILAIMLLVGITSTFVIALRQPRYTSTALLVLDRGAAELIGGKAGVSEHEVDTEVEILRAMSIVELVAARLKLESATEGSGQALSTSDGAGASAKLQDPIPGVHSASNAEGDGKSSAPSAASKDGEAKPASRKAEGKSPAQPSSAEILALQREFRIRRRGLTDVIAIEATAETPERAAKLANLYAVVYLDKQVSAKLSSAQHLEVAITQRIQALKDEITEGGSQLELRQLLKDNLSRLNQIKRRQSLTVPNLRLASPALPIANLAFPSRGLLMLLGWMLALALALAVAVFRERTVLQAEKYQANDPSTP